MKKTIYIITLLLLSACASSPISTDPIVETSQVIKLSTLVPEVSKGVVGTSTSFVEGDNIGVFQTFQDIGSSTAASVSDLSSKNFSYLYSVPYWTPLSPENMLMYNDEKRTKLFAYFPFVTLAAEEPVVELTVDNATATVDFTVPADQTATILLNKADLLYAKATGLNEAGYINQGDPINLVFNHKLTRFGFTVKIKHSGTDVPTAQTVYLRHVEIKGDNIYSGLTLDMLTGVTTNKSTTTPVFWKAYEVDGGVQLSTLAGGAAGQSSTINDFLLVPFTQLGNVNRVVFYLSDNNNVLPSELTLEEMVKQDILVDYIWEIPAPLETQFDFKEGVYNKIAATIDLAQTPVEVTATIEPWGVNNENNDIIVE